MEKSDGPVKNGSEKKWAGWSGLVQKLREMAAVSIGERMANRADELEGEGGEGVEINLRSGEVRVLKSDGEKRETDLPQSN